jgi:peptide/nickel transport system permease protein
MSAPRKSWLRGIWLPVAVLVLIVAFALLGNLLTPYTHDQSNLMARNRPPIFLGGDWTFPLGTDRLGRDMVARLVLGTRVSIGLALVGTVIGLIIGTVLGLLAARARGFVDATVMALVDLQAAIPFIIIALGVLALYGNSLTVFVLLLGFFGWEAYARMVRGGALAAHAQPYTEAARAMAVHPVMIDARHILPNVANLVIVQATLNFPQTILLETGLSFLGLGVQPPLTSLGQLLGDGRDSLTRAWWLAVMPGAVIFATTLSISLIGDALRDRLDPTLRR